MRVMYDAGVLIAAERNDRNVWAEHRVRLEAGVLPLTTAPVVAQVSRSSQQAQLRRFLNGCLVAAFQPHEAHIVGALLRRSRTSDVVDAHVVLAAASHDATVITSDIDDLTHLSDSAEGSTRIWPL